MALEGGPPAQWDDELSTWTTDQRHPGRRIAFFTVCGVLITLIILTIVFVGNDKKSLARVTTNVGVSTTTGSTLGFATSLPVAATATSFGTTTSSTATTATTTTTTNPRQTTTSSGGTTTTTAPPQFVLNPTPRQTTGPPTPPYQSTNPFNCLNQDVDRFRFDTPSPGVLQITRNPGNFTVTGKVTPQGSFDISTTTAGRTDHYVGTIDQSHAQGTYQETAPGGNCSATTTSSTWTFA
jgi:hypothetical protein